MDMQTNQHFPLPNQTTTENCGLELSHSFLELEHTYVHLMTTTYVRVYGFTSGFRYQEEMTKMWDCAKEMNGLLNFQWLVRLYTVDSPRGLPDSVRVDNVHGLSTD